MLNKPYSKEQQLFKNKTKAAKKKSKNKPTEKELTYLQWLQTKKFTCFVCGSKNMIQMHHIKERSTDAKNHKELIPLCFNHHLGMQLSPHGTPTAWRVTYSIEEQRAAANKIYEEFENEKK